MTTINISLPKPLRDYIERRAKQDHFSASEYVRNLIRLDMQRQQENLLDEYLMLCMREIDSGQVGTFDVDKLIAEENVKLRRGRAKRR